MSIAGFNRPRAHHFFTLVSHGKHTSTNQVRLQVRFLGFLLHGTASNRTWAVTSGVREPGRILNRFALQDFDAGR